MLTLHPFQELGVAHAVEFLTTLPRLASRQLYASPTGTGKSYIEAALKQRMTDLGHTLYITSPSDDILIGIAKKEGLKVPGAASKLKPFLELNGYYTPISLRNRLLKGDIAPPTHICHDEGHHEDTDTSETNDALTDGCPSVALSATPYRGTARATASFRKKWGDPLWLITLRESVAAGYNSFPKCEIVPLLDDDIITVEKGEFQVEEIAQQYSNVIDNAVALVRRYAGRRPTMLAMPNVFSAELYADALTKAGCPAVCVTAKSTRKERDIAFDKCVASEAVLVQVRVVSEGVDLPVRRLIDFSPLMSPVAFMQQLGRIMRPVPDGEEPPLYICTNRNLLRFAYLLESLLPPEVYKAGEAALGGPSKRFNARAFGFETLGKFQACEVPLHSGVMGQFVCVSAHENGIVREFAAVASPLHSDCVYAMRENVRTGVDGKTEYGRWRRIDEIPPIAKGFASISKGELSPSQLSWWNTAAKFYGLDSNSIPNRRQFQLLPLLKDLNARFR